MFTLLAKAIEDLRVIAPAARQSTRRLYPGDLGIQVEVFNLSARIVKGSTSFLILSKHLCQHLCSAFKVDLILPVERPRDPTPQPKKPPADHYTQTSACFTFGHSQ